jgi:WD40 repeat protein
LRRSIPIRNGYDSGETAYFVEQQRDPTPKGQAMRQTPVRYLAWPLALATVVVGSKALFARGLDGPPTAVTPVFEGEGLPYEDEGLTPEQKLEIYGPPARNLCFAYSPDGKTLAVGDGPNHAICSFPGPAPINENGGLIRLLDTATDRVRLTLKPTKIAGHEYEVRRVAFSPDGKTLVSAGLERDRVGRRFVETQSFTSWDAGSGRVRNRVLGAEDAPWINTAIAPDAGAVAATTERGLSLWDAATGRRTFSIRDVPPNPKALVFSPDGRKLASGYGDGTVILWDATTGKPSGRFPGDAWQGERFAIATLAFSRDGTALASIGTIDVDRGGISLYASELRIVRIAPPSVLATLRGREGEAFECLAFSPDGKTLASGGALWAEGAGNKGLLRLWDVERGSERASFPTPGRSIVSVAYSPDGQILAAADMESIVLRDAVKGEERASLVGKNWYNEFMGIEFSPDGKTLASRMNRVFRLWRPITALGTAG